VQALRLMPRAVLAASRGQRQRPSLHFKPAQVRDYSKNKKDDKSDIAITIIVFIKRECLFVLK